MTSSSKDLGEKKTEASSTLELLIKPYMDSSSKKHSELVAFFNKREFINSVNDLINREGTETEARIAFDEFYKVVKDYSEMVLMGVSYTPIASDDPLFFRSGSTISVTILLGDLQEKFNALVNEAKPLSRSENLFSLAVSDFNFRYMRTLSAINMLTTKAQEDKVKECYALLNKSKCVIM